MAGGIRSSVTNGSSFASAPSTRSSVPWTLIDAHGWRHPIWSNVSNDSAFAQPNKIANMIKLRLAHDLNELSTAFLHCARQLPLHTTTKPPNHKFRIPLLPKEATMPQVTFETPLYQTRYRMPTNPRRRNRSPNEVYRDRQLKRIRDRQRATRIGIEDCTADLEHTLTLLEDHERRLRQFLPNHDILRREAHGEFIVTRASRDIVKKLYRQSKQAKKEAEAKSEELKDEIDRMEEWIERAQERYDQVAAWLRRVRRVERVRRALESPEVE
ncbi:hypothetical protein IWZ01DRAFT_525379 [Phyllosticta capitalensis]